ncbi:hypothetical protein FRB99_003403 [Tulasnella sp. 403]|nr:hypothetical protein FRB99_003403 [Tulasnella sp. 403]
MASMYFPMNTMHFVLSLLLLWVNALPTIVPDYAPHARAVKYGIQGADNIRAVGLYYTDGNPHLTSSSTPGVAGDAMVATTPNPPTFFLKSGQLFAYVNQTTVMYVNVVDPKTDKTLVVREGMFNVQLGAKKEGLAGEFYYVGDSLHLSKTSLPPPHPAPGQKALFQFGKLVAVSETNDGLWWACEERRGHDGTMGRALYVDFLGYNFQKRPTPDGCHGFTLHSWGEWT